MALTKIDDRGLTTPIDLLDSEKIRFGTGNDLEIYHVADGNSFINDTATAGQFIIQAVNGHDIKHSNGELAIRTLVDGSTSLYHDGSKKLETHTTGVVVTGNISPDNLYLGDNEKAYFGDGSDLQIYHESDVNYILVSGKETQIVGGSGNNKKLISTNTSNAVELYHDNNKKLETTSTGISITGDINATSAADVRLTLGSSGTAGTNDSVHVRADSANLSFMAASGGITKFEANGTETLRITSTGIISINDSTPETFATLQVKNNTTNNHSSLLLHGADLAQILLRDDNGGTNEKVTTIRNDQGDFLVGTHNDAYSSWQENIRIKHAGGITFNGDTAAANALDDYEEGLWDLTGGSCNIDLHNSYDTGWYVKIGHIVTCGAYVQSDETSTDSSTNLQFTLPFATSAVPTGGDTGWVGAASLNSFALDTDVTQTTIAAGDATTIATIRLNGGHAVGWSTLKKNQFTDAKLMQFTLTYKCQ